MVRVYQTWLSLWACEVFLRKWEMDIRPESIETYISKGLYVILGRQEHSLQASSHYYVGQQLQISRTSRALVCIGNDWIASLEA